MIMALAYFLAELWHGPSTPDVAAGPGGGRVSRSSGRPRCGCSGAAVRVRPASRRSTRAPQACVGDPGQIVLTARSAGLAAVLARGRRDPARPAAAARRARNDRPGEADRRIRWIGLDGRDRGCVGLLVVGAFLPDTAIVNQIGFRIEPIALLVLLALTLVAWVIATARDARRFAAGASSPASSGSWSCTRTSRRCRCPRRSSTPTRACCRPTCTRSSSRSTPTRCRAPRPHAPLWSGGWIPAGPIAVPALSVTCLVVGYAPGSGGSRRPSRPPHGATGTRSRRRPEARDPRQRPAGVAPNGRSGPAHERRRSLDAGRPGRCRHGPRRRRDLGA